MTKEVPRLFFSHSWGAVVLVGRKITGGSRHRVKAGITAALFAVALLISRGNIGVAILVALMIATIWGLVDSRLTVVAGLLCLFSYPVLNVAERNAWLQQSPLVNYYAASVGIYSIRAVIDTGMTWAFYLLSIGLISRFTRYIVLEKNHDNV